MMLYAPKRPAADLPPVRVNLYSDTQTRPSPAMKDAMVRAEVGDEQHGDDPTVHELCDRMAALLGKQAAVFLPSGTMCNQIAILTHCRAGDEILAHETAHIIQNEGGGVGRAHRRADPRTAAASAASSTPRRCGDAFREQRRNVPTQTPARGRADGEHRRRHGLAARQAERGAGHRARTWPGHPHGRRAADERRGGIGVPAHEMVAGCDSVWVDFTKGLGAPLGAVLCGSEAFIDEAWRWKQRLGGSLRQAGMCAAACIYALDHNIDRLADDHANAKRAGARPGADPRYHRGAAGNQPGVLRHLRAPA